MKTTALISYFTAEANRYTELAKEIALGILKKPDAEGTESDKRRAQHHLIRAETFREAARIAAGHS